MPKLKYTKDKMNDKCVTLDSLYAVIEDVMNSDAGSAVDKLEELYYELMKRTD